MKKNVTLKNVTRFTLSLSLFLVLTGSLSAFAQQSQSKPKGDERRTEKAVTSYSTEKYYFTKNKLSKAALRKKLLKMSGVKKVDINTRGSYINITFDPQQAPKDHLKKNLRQWGTPGDFNKPKGEQGDRQQESQSQNRKGGQQVSQDKR
ncbi:MAG: hypothetical protein H6Q14_739 [Bacteroidetes bacterium]|jgi:hypothetical protein|nr:hypothetical protein [Bacteroidota bacterium]